MANKGKLIDVKPVNLLAEVIKNLVSHSKINPKEIDDVVIGCAFQVGEQCFNIGRLVTFLSDLDMRVPGMSVDRWCGSSMEAIHIAAGKIAMGSGKIFICGGVESMGYMYPEIVTSMVAVGEVAAGAGIILGGLVSGHVGNLITRLSGGAVVIIMIGAILIAHSDWLITKKLFMSEQIFLLILGLFFAIKGNNK